MNTNFMAKVADFFRLLFKAFIEMHTMMFDLLDNFAWSYGHFGLGYAIWEKILAVFGLICILVFDLLMLYGLYALIRRISIIIRTKDVKCYSVLGTVTDKKYVAAHTTYMSTGKVTIPVVHSSNYKVYVQYGEVSGEFNNKDLFNQYSKGDAISLILVKKLGKNDKVIEQTLELPE